MGIKSKLVYIARKFFSLLGVDAFFFRRNKHNNYVILDINYLSRYYSRDYFIRLYSEAVKKTHSASGDTFKKQCRYYGTYQTARYVIDANIPGDFAECGCWRGHSAYIIAELIRQKGITKNFYIFDSFEGGLSDKTNEDKDLLANIEPEKVRKEKQSFYSTKKEVAKNLSRFEFVTLHKGWIPKPFSIVNGKQFAFVNLDLDLYQPIKDSLEFFYPRLSEGGIIVVDDYGITRWPGVKKAVDQFLELNRVKFSLETLGSMIILK
jgi:hypothetical protein